jgi:hypothetical protein
MPCTPFKVPGGYALVRRGRRAACSVCHSAEHELLCDGRDVGASGTCDAKLCRRCALHAPGDKDFCPRHISQARLQRQFPFQPRPR